MFPYLLVYLVWPNITRSIYSTFLKFPSWPSLGDYSSTHGIYGDPKTNFFVTISVTEMEKSDQIKVFNLTDVNLDI